VCGLYDFTSSSRRQKKRICVYKKVGRGWLNWYLKSMTGLAEIRPHQVVPPDFSGDAARLSQKV
jgi:hypothetical protein